MLYEVWGAFCSFLTVLALVACAIPVLMIVVGGVGIVVCSVVEWVQARVRGSAPEE